MKRASAFLLVILLMGCSKSTYHAAQSGSNMAGLERRYGYTRVGGGRYPHLLNLKNPETGKIWSNAPFAFWIDGADLPFLKDPKKVYRGVTDGSGSTPIFYLNKRYPDHKLQLVELKGQGPNGSAGFVLRDRKNRLLKGWRYFVVACGKPPIVHKSYSNDKGQTAFFASEEPSDIHLYIPVVGAEADEDALKLCKE